MRHRAGRYAWLITVFFLTSTASAQPQPEHGSRPWDKDVSVEDRRAAKMLFEQAVELHEQLLRGQAVVRYEEALSLWENPHIRWNLALLMNDMGQYLRAYEHLENALAWGAEAFDQLDWKKLTQMQQMLLRQRLAVIEARCDQPDTQLALDGKPWFRGLRAARQVVLPGEHVLTAKRSGYLPLARTISLQAGTQGTITVFLEDSIFVKRRWTSWKPRAVLGGGTAMGLAGAGLGWFARWRLPEARQVLVDRCGQAPACPPMTPPGYRRSVWLDRFATGVVATGGVAVAAGLVLMSVNRPRSYRTKDRIGATFELTPMASADAAGISARFRF